ncbi:MAG TPA: hypothetical protein VFE15_00040 [Marmoricola sp.]|jgi:hypothetical protein|nr:hypothetical protein [Marmoricola sp.]
MELIEIELTEFTRRSRSLEVAHSTTSLSRGLEHGERVLVRADGQYRTAVVADVTFDLEDTCYRLVLGGRIATLEAEDRLLGEITVTPSDVESSRVSVQDVADMLARSGAAHRIPLQRQVARRLLDR